MKGLIVKASLLLFVCTCFAIFANAQGSSYATVKGVVRDATGAPVPDAQVLWENTDNGRKYKLKTNKKGEYFSLGVDPGTYNITVTSKDGQPIDKVSKFHAGVGDVEQDFDAKQNQQQDIKESAKKQGVSQEQAQKQMQERQAEASKVQQYNANVKAVNEKLNAANAYLKAQPPNYPQAIATIQEAANMAPDQSVVWYRLGNAYLNSAKTQTDAAERTKQYNEAYTDLHKAVDLEQASAAQKAGQSQPPVGGKPPAASGQQSSTSSANNERLAAYYDNLGAVAGAVGKPDEAATDYQKSAELDPANAANYYFRMGVTLHNSAKDTEGKKKAAEAFDKAIAADPTKADAYFLKGSDLFALVTTDSEGKMVPAPGTTEALNKYLELQPNGSHAEEAKQMLAALNTSVETTYGTKKGTTPTKKK